MKVRDIMSTDVETATPDTTLEQIATMMKEQDVGSIPVVDGDELTGIVTDRDIVVRCIATGDDPSEVEAEQILSGDLQTVEPDDDVEQAARIMSRHQIRRLPVVEDGELVGMVSIGDIAVKEDEDTAGDALEDISEGVKGKRNVNSARGNKQPVAISGGGSARGREESSARGRNAGSASARGKQGISNRASGDEIERQQRVNPKRAASGSSGPRRRKTG